MMSKSKNSNNTGAFFLLLLFLLSISVFKGIFSLSVPDRNPCNKKVFVEISGDIACPGVYEFCQLPDLKDLLERWLPVRTKIARCQHLFINIRRGTPLTYGGLRSILDNLGDKTGIYTTPHEYRRGGAKYFADNGGSDSEGMSQGGWKSHSTYRRYTGSASIKGFKKKRWMNKY